MVNPHLQYFPYNQIVELYAALLLNLIQHLIIIAHFLVPLLYFSFVLEVPDDMVELQISTRMDTSANSSSICFFCSFNKHVAS